MKKKVNKVSKLDYLNDDQREVLRFVVILLVIIVVVVIIYFISYFASLKNEYHYNDEATEATINYDTVTVGTMFNRPEGTYYVALYKDDLADAVYYSALFNKYMNQEDALKIYYCNLNNKLNEKYYTADGKSNPKATSINDVKFGEFTFVKISKGKITKYYEDITKVKKELNIQFSGFLFFYLHDKITIGA